jgi:hypothetical protein
VDQQALVALHEPAEGRHLGELGFARATPTLSMDRAQIAVIMAA